MRCAFVSMQIASGRNVLEIARQAGHAATLTTDTYGHVYEAFEGKPPIDIVEEVRAARRQVKIQQSGLMVVPAAAGDRG